MAQPEDQPTGPGMFDWMGNQPQAQPDQPAPVQPQQKAADPLADLWEPPPPAKSSDLADLFEKDSPMPATPEEAKQTSWYDNVVGAFKGAWHEGTGGFEEGELSKSISARMGQVAGADAPRILKAINQAELDIFYPAARSLETVINAMNGAIRAPIVGIGAAIGMKEQAETVASAAADPGLQASLAGLGPPGAFAAGILKAFEPGKVRITSGLDDVTSLTRAADASITGPAALIKPEMTPAEVAKAQVKTPSSVYTSNISYDAVQTSEKPSANISGTFVKTELPAISNFSKEVLEALPKLDTFATDGRVSAEWIHAHLANGHPGLSLKGVKEELATAQKAGELDVTEAGVKAPESAVTMTARVHTDPADLLVGDEPVENAAAKAIERQVIGNLPSGAVAGRDYGPELGIKPDPAKVGEIQGGSIHGFDSLNGHVRLQDGREMPVSQGAGVIFGGDGTEISPTVIAAFKQGNGEVWIPVGKHRTPITRTGRELYDALAEQLGPQETSRRLAEAGIPGMKTAEGHVLFDSSTVEPLNVKGEPVPPPPPMKPPEAPPRATDGIVTDRKGNIRSEVLKDIHNDADVRALVDKMNEENGGFSKARAGEMPAENVNLISDVTGIPADELSRDKIVIKFNNEGKVRAGLTALRQTALDWHAAAKSAMANNDIESLIEYKRTELTHGVFQEFVSGTLADAGRSLAATQDHYDGTFSRKPLKAEEAKPKAKAGEAPEKPEFGPRAGIKQMDKVKTKEDLEAFLKARGEGTIEELRQQAEAVSKLDPTGNAVSRFGNLLATGKGPRSMAWYKKVYINFLTSGMFSHFGYALMGPVLALVENTANPILGGAYHNLQSITGKVFEPGQRLYMSEAIARNWGAVAGIPEAFMSMLQAIKTDRYIPLPPEAKTGVTGGQILGLPQGSGPVIRTAIGIHTFHRFIGYRATIQGDAWARAIENGFDPARGETFYRKVKDYAANPTPETERRALENGQRMSLTTPLGERLGPISHSVSSSPAGFLIAPFTHVPVNIVKQSMEDLPILNLIDRTSRDNLLGRNGEKVKGEATGRMLTGMALGSAAALLYTNDMSTGGGPVDPTARAEWLLTHQPYSIRFAAGGSWHSYAYKGSLSQVLAAGAAIAEIGHAAFASMNEPDQVISNKEFTEAAGLVAHAFGHLTDEASLSDFVQLEQAMHSSNENDMLNFLKNWAGTAVPTGAAQIASSTDPYMRETWEVLDALRARIPGQRQQLPLHLDWLGTPVPNPKYGAGGMAATKPANETPLNLELQRLNIKPTPMPKVIGSIPLTVTQWNEYQTAFGEAAHRTLDPSLSNPNWIEKPDFTRKTIIEELLKSAREIAKARMQAKPEFDFIRRIMDDKAAALRGERIPDLFQRPPK